MQLSSEDVNYHLGIDNKAKWDDVTSPTDQREKAWKGELFQWEVVSQRTRRDTTLV